MTASDPRVGEIQARLDAATPRPWGSVEDTYRSVPMLRIGSHVSGTDVAQVIMHAAQDKADAEFIAAAPADVAYLLAELADRDEKLARVEAIASGMDKIADFHMEILGHKDSMAISLRQHAINLRAAVAAATGDEES